MKLIKKKKKKKKENSRRKDKKKNVSIETIDMRIAQYDSNVIELNPEAFKIEFSKLNNKMH